MVLVHMIHTKKLQQLQSMLMDEYILYKKGLISEKEYRIKVKPIDMAISKLEMSILQDTLVYKATFLQHSLKLEH